MIHLQANLRENILTIQIDQGWYKEVEEIIEQDAMIDAGTSTPHQASQRVDKEIQLGSASTYVFEILWKVVAPSFE